MTKRRLSWHKRLEKGRFVWPSPADGCLHIPGVAARLTCWTASTGGTRNGHSGRSWRNSVRAAAQNDATRRAAAIIPVISVMPAPDTSPNDIAALRAALAAEQLARREAEARASGAEAMVTHLKLLIAMLKRDKYGASSERGRKLIDQRELELGELVAAASEDATKAEDAAQRPNAA